jgi:hypothetical protein
MKELVRMLKEGLAVYSPIVHCHELAKIVDMPRAAGFWEKYNFVMLEAAETFGILMLPGWEESVGIAGETKKAQDCRLRIIRIEPGERP